MSSITITFGDQAQNHKGMQIIGKAAERGWTEEQLKQAQKIFEKQGYKCQLINLNQFVEQETEKACVLVIKKGVNCLLEGKNMNEKDLYEELSKLDWDSKAFMYGRVVTKHARHNLCFNDEPQDPQYENGKGRVISWKNVPLLAQIKKQLPKYIKEAEELAAQGNYYYDIKKCGIGFHGDAERKKVIALRLCTGKCHPIHYQWFLKGLPIGKRAIIQLQDGDVYIMSSKAVGTDWKKKNIPTLRHATGCQKFTKI